MALTDFFKRRSQEFVPRQLPLRRIKDEKPQGGGKWILGLFLGSIFLSLGVWFWGSFSRDQGQVATGSVLPTITPASLPRKTEEITKKIKTLTNNLSGSYGVYVYNLTTKESYGLLPDEIFTAASLMKLPVILTLYQEVEKGNLSLEAKYVLRQEDKRVGAGSLAGRPVGSVYTYKQLAQLMGHLSDNTAYAALSRVLGEQKIQATIDNLGMSQTSFARNETTPANMGLFFRKLYGGSIVSREHRDEILSFITDTAYEDRIPAGVPEGVKVAHKIGNEIGVFSDAGIVFADRPFILVMLSKNALEKEAKSVLPAITKAVWEFESQ